MSKIKNYHIFEGNIVKIFSCTNCNTKCEHCYVSLKGNYSKNQIDEVVDNLKDRFEIRINGTEPLMHKEYLDALENSKSKLVLTNGLVFKDNYDYISELAKRNLKTIGISYHFDIHDAISKVSKKYLDELFQEIIKRGLNVQIMTTITSQNYKNVYDYCEYCFKNGIKKIRFTNFIKQGNASNLDDNLVLNDEQLQEFFDSIDHLREIYPKEILEIQRCGSFGKNKKSTKEFQCGAGTDSVVIAPDLSVYPCLFLTQPEYKIGYYKDGNIYIDNEYKNDNNDCSAVKILNRKKVNK